MKKISAAALAGLMLATTPTHAADLFGTAAPPMSMSPSDGPAVEVGSNWYIRGDVGLGFEDSPTVVPSAGLIPAILVDPGTGATYTNQPIGDAAHNVSVTRGNNRSDQTATFDIGLGYRLNDFIRLEGTYNFWRGPGLATSQSSLCPDTTRAVNNMIGPVGGTTAVPAGNLWEPVPCTGYLNAQQYNNLGLGSAYLDLGTYWGFTPYVGAGGGVNANTISGSTTFTKTNDGKPYAGDTSAAAAPWVVQTGIGANGFPIYTALANQPQVVFGPQNWNRSFLSTKFTFAAALMAGVGFQLSPSATLDIGYRYLNPDAFGSNKNTVHQVQVGIRYMAN